MAKKGSALSDQPVHHPVRLHLVQMALVWYAAMETASGGWVAAFSVCSYLPQFLVSFLGGVWADRYNRKALIIGADVLIACATLAMIPALPHIPSGPALLGGLLGHVAPPFPGAGIQAPAVNAAIPQLVPEDQLMRYNGLNAAMQSLVNFAAPAAAGAVFAVSDLRTTLMIDVVTAVVGTGLLSCLALPGQRGTRERSPLLADIRAGVSCAFSHRLAGRLLVLYGLVTFFCVPGGYLAGLFVRPDLWGDLLVSYSGGAGRLCGDDSRRSADEHLGRLPAQGEDPDGGPAGFWRPGGRDGAVPALCPLSGG